MHNLNEFVASAFVMFGRVQSEVLLALNSVEPGRPLRANSYVPVCGAVTLISKDPFFLKKTSLVDRSTLTASSFAGAKGSRKTTSHGGGGWLGEGGGDGSGGGGLGGGGGGDGEGGGDGLGGSGGGAGGIGGGGHAPTARTKSRF